MPVARPVCLLAVLLCALAEAREEAETVRYSLMMRQIDVAAADYRVDGRASEGRFSFRPPAGTPEWMQLSVSASVDGRRLPAFRLRNGETDVAQRPSQTLVYTNAEATAELEFKPFKAVLRLALHRSSPTAVSEVRIGEGSRTDSSLLFDPSVRVTPYHEFPVAEPCSIAPGLASPPPWVFSYRREGRSGCWSAALEPESDRIDFRTFDHVPAEDGRCCWSVRYPRTDPAAGDLVLPPLVFRFGDADYFAALQRHVDDLRAEGKMTVPARRLPAWHARTIACTWRYQREEPRREQATEKNCESYVKMLEDNGIDFGTLIIDDFWGREHGLWEADPAKWTDLRGFIDRQHAKGRRVLLWICTDGEGLSAEERRGSQWNIESPAYQARLKAAARRLLSSEPGCYDADGVKFDFTSSMPGDCRGLKFVGCGYIRRRFEMVTDALLAVKPEAILDYQCYNPYFTHTLTMLRLNDYFGSAVHGLPEMRLRAKIAAICAPGALIDTDHIGFRQYSYDGAYDFFRAAHELGVPSLYLGPQDMEDSELMKAIRTGHCRGDLP